MYVKKLGNIGITAVNNLQSQCGALPSSKQLTFIKKALQNDFGTKAVAYFEQKLSL